MREKKLKKLIQNVIKEFIVMTKIYSIKDTVTGNFSNIVTAPVDGVVIRDLQNMLKSTEQTDLTMNYKDKQLFCLGEYDVATGLINTDVKFIINLSELKGE